MKMENKVDKKRGRWRNCNGDRRSILIGLHLHTHRERERGGDFRHPIGVLQKKKDPLEFEFMQIFLVFTASDTRKTYSKQRHADFSQKNGCTMHNCTLLRFLF